MPQTMPDARSPWPVVLIGLVALAIAMGIGRFAFTPMMPLMLRDGTLSAVAGTEWAAANYAGYLGGALTASVFARAPRRGLQIGLLGVVLTTLLIAAVDAGLSGFGLALRAAAGVFSAWVLVCASSWCLSELVRRHATTRGGWIYVGVGTGIALTGLMTWLGGAQSARILWIELGVLAALGSVYVMRSLHRQAGPPVPVADRADLGAAAPAAVAAGGNLGLVLCYGAFGFGYIIPATYLPTMARQLVSDPLVFGLTWPIFGMAAAVSVAVVSRWLAGCSHRRLWAVAQATMALGTLLPLLQKQALWALAASALLVGGTFMITTMAGLQLARERAGANPTALLARMTAGFAAGQIAGPLLVRLIGEGEFAGWAALDWANALATLLLVTTALWLWRSDGTARG